MLIIDEIKKNDPHLRLVALVFAGGFCVLVVGLWWMQIVSARKYQSHLETQAYRSVRIPSLRGKIFDREGRVLAENRPRYNLSLFLGDLQKKFSDAYDQLHKAAIANQKQAIAAEEKKLGRALTKAERKQFALTTEQLEQLRQQARVRVAGGAVAQVGRELGQPIAFDPVRFERQYKTRLALPYTVVTASPALLARFEEGNAAIPGVDVELQSIRNYPAGATTAHLLGYVQRDDSSKEGDDAYFDYYLPDYRGVTGIEWGFDSLLRGRAGGESVLVNSVGYRQSENILDAPEAGHNVVLTIDLDLQSAAAAALAAHQGPEARAAAVIMDVRTGDVLAMVSSPAFDPDYFSGGLSAAEFQAETAFLSNTNLRPRINRATQENYAPGSIFKPIVGLAALERGLNPNEVIYNPENPNDPGHGYYKFSAAFSKKDTAPPGDYNFTRAIERSCNTYFITIGLRVGIQDIVRLAEKFHFGEREDLPLRQETRGIFPSLERVNRRDWRDGNTADVCIGQEIDVTPMQIAVAYSAIANGGTILWPRLVERIESPDATSGTAVTNFPASLVRDHIGVSARSLQVLREAMLSETEDPEGTGQRAVVGPEMRICGKTGTAQRKDEHGQMTGWNYWFASFAPYENPKYAVVVMVQSEGRGSGGTTCAPIAHDIYAAILAKEKGKGNTPTVATARRDGQTIQ